jgi:hypothetical protein
MPSPFRHPSEERDRSAIKVVAVVTFWPIGRLTSRHDVRRDGPSRGYDCSMDVLAPPEVVDYVRERGGQLYVWTFKGG